MTHVPIFCEACRTVLLIPNDHISLELPPFPWRFAEGYFCSDECEAKGPAKPARERVEAHVDFERGSQPHPERHRGRMDALLGYDCAGHRPHYVKGHGEGMEVRKIVEAAIEELKNKGPS